MPRGRLDREGAADHVGAIVGCYVGFSPASLSEPKPRVTQNDRNVVVSRRPPIDIALRAAIVVMAVLAAGKLGTEFYRLVLSNAPTGAIDLKMRYEEVHWWFSRRPVYTGLEQITYPPEAYVVLWPFLGWAKFAAARWIWALISVVMLGALTRLMVRESGAGSTVERAFVALMVLSMNAVGVCIGNGQLALLVLPVLTAALLILHRSPPGWRSDLGVTALFLVALIKPTLALPFIPVAVASAQRARPFLLTVISYVGLTFFAAHFQDASLAVLTKQWLMQSQEHLGGGYGDLQSALIGLHLERWVMPAALLFLLVASVWMYRSRKADVWILIGVAALVARLWTYHRVYDDVLLLLPMVTLFRIARRHDGANHVGTQSVVLLVITVLAMLAPARMETSGQALHMLFVGGHVAVWLTILCFLVVVAERDRRAAGT
jgi:hypothetical protein